MSEAAAKIARSPAHRTAGTGAFFARGSAVQRQCSGCAPSPFFAPAPQVQRAPADDAGPENDADGSHLLAPDVAGSGGGAPEAPVPEPGGAADDGGDPSGSITVQPSLEVGPVNDPLETEADQAADRVVRREAATSALATETRVQAKAEVGAAGGAAGPELTRDIEGARGRGASLAGGVRARMEDAFGVDLSPVRVHTGAESARLNDRMGARAFTYGTDIHFNWGQFDPASPDGTRLLAHELTHVIQQNAGLRRKARTETAIQRAARPVVRRDPLAFGPIDSFPGGSRIHSETLPQILVENAAKPISAVNTNLFIEPGVPRQTSKPDPNTGHGEKISRGKPDFYRAKTLIGVIKKPPDEFGGINEGKRGPLKPLKPGLEFSGFSSAPQEIGLADLKPARSGEASLGSGQINEYIAGIGSTAMAVNAYQAKLGKTEFWHPVAVPATGIDIPSKLQTPSFTKGFGPAVLALYDFAGGFAWKKHDTELKGSLVVYEVGPSDPGIYGYEWYPEDVPETSGNKQVKALLDELETTVKPKLTAHQKPMPKRMPGPQRPARPVVRRQPVARGKIVRRAPKPQQPFDEAGWKKVYDPWKDKAAKTIADPKAKKTGLTFEALEEAGKRAKIAKPMPVVKEQAHAYRQVAHWKSYGHLYAWFRKRFDWIWGKLSRFGASIKEKVAKLGKRMGSTSFGNWAKAAAKALFKVFKVYASWAVSEIADKLVDSLQDGVMNVGKALVTEALPEGAKSGIEELYAARGRIDEFASASYADLEKKIFGDHISWLEDLDRIMGFVSTITSLINVVKWGIKIAACAAPPLVGCLWNLAIAALEYAFTKIIETCWFSKKIFGWFGNNTAVAGIKALWEFPNTVASGVVEKANGIFKIPGMPEGVTLFAPIAIRAEDFKAFEGECDGGGGDGGGAAGQALSEEQRELMRIADAVGYEKFEAFIEMTSRRAAGHAVALSAERIRALKIEELIANLTAEQMKAIANGQTGGTPVPIEEFLKSIAAYTPDEQQRIAKRNIDYEKAARANLAYKARIGWDPTKFVEKDRNIPPDSRDFADAVYDAQEMLGFATPDGMAGPKTVKAFYEKNRQDKDAAYANAALEVAAGESGLTPEQLREIIEIKRSPYPSVTDLARDAKALPYPPSGNPFAFHDARKIIYGRTNNGVQIAGYFKEFTLERGGRKTRHVIDTSSFYAFDAIAETDGFGMSRRDETTGQQLIDIFVFWGAVPKDTVFSVDGFFNGVRLD